MRLLYAPFAGGFVWERRDGRRSQVFRTEADARAALRAGACRWEG
jgi:hypothetical protein